MKILRPEQIMDRLGVGRTRLYTDILLRDQADPYIPNTTIPRLRLFPIGERSSGALESDLDVLIEALASQPMRKVVPIRRERENPKRTKVGVKRG
jgi:predicted nucleotidyltransferase